MDQNTNIEAGVYYFKNRNVWRIPVMKRKMTAILMSVIMVMSLTPFIAYAHGDYPWDNDKMKSVTFYDYDGSLLHIVMVPTGSAPSYNYDTPTRPSDDYYTYTFAGWDPDLAEVDYSPFYYATYTAKEKDDPDFAVSVDNADNIIYDNDVTIRGSVSTKATGAFQITIKDSKGNERNSAASFDNGKASVTLSDIPEGECKVTAVYSGNEKYKKVTKNTSFTVKPIPIIEWTSENSLPGERGSYKLVKDVDLGTDCWNVPAGKTSIDLNGKNITSANDDDGAILLKAEENQICKLNLYDNSEKSDGTITSTEENGVQLVAEDNGSATFNMFGGRIANCDDYGVLVDDPGTSFNMYNGEISNCYTGVYSSIGTYFNMYNGKISGCQAAGVKTAGNAEFTLHNGEITDNSLGVDVDGIFRMENGSITKNKQGVQTYSSTNGIIFQGGEIAPVIIGNIADDNKHKNLCINRDNDLKITVSDGTMLSGNTQIGITATKDGEFTNGLNGKLPWDVNQFNVFSSDDPDYTIRYASGLQLVASLDPITPDPGSILMSSIDVVEDCKDGSIVIHGWVFDSNHKGQSVEVQVCIGGEAGTDEAEAHTGIIADMMRTDVDNVFHCGEYHGFTAFIPTDKRGNQKVYIYGGSGNGQLIGSTDVYITDPAPKQTKVKVPGSRTLTYNGKKQIGVDEGKGYTISGTKSAVKAGTYQAKAALNKGYVWTDGTANEKTIKWKINKAANPLKINGKTAKVKYTKIKKKAQILAVTKVIKFDRNGQGKMSYKISSVKKKSKEFKGKITINKNTGNVKVNKGLKKGTYIVKAKVRAEGNANYKASDWMNVKFKIKVN